MQAAEAITRLIAIADKYAPKVFSVEATEETRFKGEQDQLAISIAQAMLNSMIPVARFRVFIRIESGPLALVGAEYTVCCVDIKGVKAAVDALRHPRSRQLYIQLWEQRPTGADMLQGFQGKAGLLDDWLRSLDLIDAVMN